MATMFDRYGGFGAVHKIVLSFYDRLLDSDVVGGYFDDVDLPALLDHQTKFFSQLMGGPASYSNEVLEQVHRHLGITQEAFDETTRLLDETLVEFAMREDDRRTIMAEIRSRQPYIVARG